MRWRLLLIFLLAAALAGTACAHQPRLVTGTDVTIKNPEVSQAFYGKLPGKPVYFTVSSDKPFRLYVNILVPYSVDSRPVAVDILRDDGTLITTLQGNLTEWEPYFEEFGGDSYFKGPEFNRTVEPGTYRIRVRSQTNRDPYVLAVGDIESFPPAEALNALLLLPLLKSDVFGVPVLPLFMQFLGMVAGMGAFLAILIFSRSGRGSPEIYRSLKRLGWGGILLLALGWALTYITNPLNIMGNVENIVLLLIVVLNWRFNRGLPGYRRFSGLFLFILWMIFLFIRASLINY